MNQTNINELLELSRSPVAVKFQESAPEGVSRIDAAAVSGCTYWKLASEGQTFFTEASDHFGCPIGAHTHGVDLPEETAQELEGLVGTMVELQYIAMEEVPGIPQLEEPFGVAVYAPLADASFEPDVVLLSGTPFQMMLLGEAVHAAGLASDGATVGRPTCAAIPAVMQSGRATANFGCIGNREYTGLQSDELYFVIPGSKLNVVAEKLNTIVKANRELQSFHRGRIENQN